MCNDWIHWLSSQHPDELLGLLLPVLCVDGLRYTLGAVVMCLCDVAAHAWRALLGRPAPPQFSYCPSVCAILAGLNEADTIAATLGSLYGTYPRLQIIVVDDGSNDGMSDIAHAFARTHEGVLVLTKPRRGGKSSALNFALPFTSAEVLVCVDTDSHLAEGAIWEMVQPFANPRVGAVSGTVIARNAFTNLCTWLQAFEYLRCIFIGRMFAEKLGILGIVSGALGAFRRDALERLGGWDVGPGEDGDLTLRLRKVGYHIAVAPYAQCLTNLPTSFRRLFKQRRRWDWAVVTFECRKHLDMANVFSPNFRFSNLLMLIDRWTYNIVLLYLGWGYFAWLCFNPHSDLWKLFLLYYVLYVVMEVLQLLVVVYYSTDRRRCWIIGLIAPLSPFYFLYLKAASLAAVTEELFWRRSFQDNFVPKHVRDVTWHW